MPRPCPSCCDGDVCDPCVPPIDAPPMTMDVYYERNLCPNDDPCDGVDPSSLVVQSLPMTLVNKPLRLEGDLDDTFTHYWKAGPHAAPYFVQFGGPFACWERRQASLYYFLGCNIDTPKLELYVTDENNVTEQPAYTQIAHAGPTWLFSSFLVFVDPGAVCDGPSRLMHFVIEDFPCPAPNDNVYGALHEVTIT